MENNLCNLSFTVTEHVLYDQLLSQLSELSAKKKLWHTCRKQLWVWKKAVLWEQKVLSQGRMLGYLFFSLLASLLASSYVPLALPPGKNYNMKIQLGCTPYWGGFSWSCDRFYCMKGFIRHFLSHLQIHVLHLKLRPSTSSVLSEWWSESYIWHAQSHVTLTQILNLIHK